ncbi:MAG: hypothetical protein GX654_04185 [Desulfatiglans sp.]|jgi:hypothetical protein|nr:hypothetical protein [Desulfatiglans sp.]
MTLNSCKKYMVTNPLREAGKDIKGRSAPVMTYMSNDLVPGCNKYIDISWITGMPDPNPHVIEHVLDYDRVIFFVGSDPFNLEDLGAEITYYLGGQPIKFDTTTAIYIKRGIKHGPAIWNSFSRPHLEISIIMGPEKNDRAWVDPMQNGKSSEIIPQKNDEVDYEKYVVRKPLILQGTDVTDAMESPAQIYMSSALISESKLYVDFGWIPGVPGLNPPIPDHSHDYEEVVLLVGNDPNNPEVLGAELEFCINDEPLTFDTTTAIYAPKSLKHGPLTWKGFERPHLLMPIVFGTGSIAEAAPAGYRE